MVDTLARSIRPDFMIEDGLSEETILEFAILKIAY
jgi:hypothetical protein